MVVAQWFLRIGQYLAPDQNYNPENDAEAQRSPFWDTVAPDPNFGSGEHAVEGMNGAAGPATPRFQVNNNNNSNNATVQVEATPPTPQQQQQQQQSALFSTPSQQLPSSATPSPFFTPCATCQKKLCPSCRQNATAVEIGFQSPQQPQSAPSATASLSSGLLSPRRKGRYVPSNEVRANVLDAAEGLALAQTAPDKDVGRAFRYCVLKSESFATGKNPEKFKKMLKNNPGLLTAYSTNMANLCPDGYTLFLGAAYNNNRNAVQVMWECVNNDGWNGITPEQLLQQTNLQGRTAFHVCGEQGSEETLLYITSLQKELFGTESFTPKDLLGFTPLGLALTSPAATKRCSDILFSPKDPSIWGEQLSADERCISIPGLHFEAGTAEIPGKRVFMEDYMVAHVLEGKGVLTAVCDGHSDKGKVAQFVGEYLVQSFAGDPDFPLQKSVEWEAVCTQICLLCDTALNDAGLKTGGAVAVWTIVTATQIVVVNVGDCRCILLQHQEDDANVAALTKATENMSLEDSQNVSIAQDEPSIQKDKRLEFKVIPLSTDHKPNLDSERSRIEEAGLSVVEERYLDRQEIEQTIHKVKLSPGNLMACSRSFGDFEYKTNPGKLAEEQAVTAAPEVNIHARSSLDSFLVIACDGVWDVMSNEDVASFVAGRLKDYHHGDVPSPGALLPTIADELLIECIERGASDNLSVFLVALSNWADELNKKSPAKRKIAF